MFAKTSLLFPFFCIQLFVANYVCVVPYDVMRILDVIVRLSLGLQRARPLWSGASDKLTSSNHRLGSAGLNALEELLLRCWQ